MVDRLAVRVKRPTVDVPDDQLLRPAVVARLLGISTKTLAKLPIRRLRMGPRMVRYRHDWVRDYIESAAA
jgi:predicted DNA-binding transcriptional regulator AlpA